jgi:hypothetical protein
MKRTVALTVALCFVTVTSAFAQGRAQARMDFSAKAAGITSVAPASAKAIEFSRKTAKPPKAGKSFFKSPWPYVIIGAVIAVVVVVSQGYDDDGGGGYQ